LAIGAETKHGQHHERVWRTEGGFAASAVADQLHWQLDSWQTGANRPTGPLSRLWLAPDEELAAGAGNSPSLRRDRGDGPGRGGKASPPGHRPGRKPSSAPTGCLCRSGGADAAR
jgi:hypothetical protein